MDCFTAISPFVRFMMDRFGKLEVVGKGYLQTDSGAVVVCNHQGWADPMWLTYAIQPITLYFMAKKELFSNALMSWIMTQSHVFSVDRNRTSPRSIKKAIDLLKAGHLVMIYPSGTRSHSPTELKRGAATIAHLAGVPVIPAHYSGPDTLRGAHLFARPEIRVQFAPPIAPAADADRAAIADFSSQIAAALDALGASAASA